MIHTTHPHLPYTTIHHDIQAKLWEVTGTDISL